MMKMLISIFLVQILLCFIQGIVCQENLWDTTLSYLSPTIATDLTIQSLTLGNSVTVKALEQPTANIFLRTYRRILNDVDAAIVTLKTSPRAHIVYRRLLISLANRLLELMSLFIPSYLMPLFTTAMNMLLPDRTEVDQIFKSPPQPDFKMAIASGLNAFLTTFSNEKPKNAYQNARRSSNGKTILTSKFQESIIDNKDGRNDKPTELKESTTINNLELIAKNVNTVNNEKTTLNISQAESSKILETKISEKVETMAEPDVAINDKLDEIISEKVEPDLSMLKDIESRDE